MGGRFISVEMLMFYLFRYKTIILASDHPPGRLVFNIHIKQFTSQMHAAMGERAVFWRKQVLGCFTSLSERGGLEMCD